MVIALAVVNIIAFTRIENEVRTSFKKADYMSVGKLCRITYRI